MDTMARASIQASNLQLYLLKRNKIDDTADLQY